MARYWSNTQPIGLRNLHDIVFSRPTEVIECGCIVTTCSIPAQAGI
jgi:hypothetical protein